MYIAFMLRAYMYLQVPMDDMFLMAVLHGRHDLWGVRGGG